MNSQRAACGIETTHVELLSCSRIKLWNSVSWSVSIGSPFGRSCANVLNSGWRRARGVFRLVSWQETIMFKWSFNRIHHFYLSFLCGISGWSDAHGLWAEMLVERKLWAELGWTKNSREANKSRGPVIKVEESFWLEPPGWWSMFEQISSPNFCRYFWNEKCQKKIWENACMRVLALRSRISLSSRIILTIRVFYV